MSRGKRVLSALVYVIVLGFILRQAQQQHVALALFLGILCFDLRWRRRAGAAQLSGPKP